MGYRSNWKLAIKGTEGQVACMIDWMIARADERGDAAKVMHFIISSREATDSERLLFADVSTKCYDPWDQVIADIQEHATSLGLDNAYLRIGEGPNDIESDDRVTSGEWSMFATTSIELDW